MGLSDPSLLLFVCSWTVKEQCVNLLAKKLWEELLDDEQPDITIMDWCAPPYLTARSCHPRLPRAQASLLPRA